MIIEKDLLNNVKVVTALDAVALGATGANAGRIIDRQGYSGPLFCIQYNAITTTGTIVTALLKEGDVTGTLTSVADADMVGTEVLASLLAATPRASGTTKLVAKKLQYKGNKRYVQLSLNGTGVTSVGYISATAVLFNPAVAPTSNP